MSQELVRLSKLPVQNIAAASGIHDHASARASVGQSSPSSDKIADSQAAGSSPDADETTRTGEEQRGISSSAVTEGIASET